MGRGIPLPPPLAEYEKCRVVGPIQLNQNGQRCVPIECKRCLDGQAVVRLVLYNRKFIDQGGQWCVTCYRKTIPTHGMSRSRTYQCWISMWTRVLTDKRYIKRGIGCGPEWESFPQFLNDMGKIPDDKYSLDRIDNEQGYGFIIGPDGELMLNCRWADRIEQANNKSTNIIVVLNGMPMTLIQAARALNVDYDALRWHVSRTGKTLERALKIMRKEVKRTHSRPAGRCTYVTIEGKRMTLKEAAAASNVSYGKLIHHYSVMGRPIDVAIARARKHYAKK